MTGFLILVKDNINNTYSIYNNKKNSDFKDCIEFLEKETSLQFKNVIIDDKICELFLEKKSIQKGWVWNTDINDTVKMYTLSFVSILNKSEKVESFTQTTAPLNVDKNIQISPIPIITKNTQTNTNLNTNLPYNPIDYFKYEIDEDYICSNNYKPTQPTTTQASFSQPTTTHPTTTHPTTTHLTTTQAVTTQAFFSQPITTQAVTAQAVTAQPFFCNKDYSLNDKLITELKQHLNTTNYGLRRRKKNNKL